MWVVPSSELESKDKRRLVAVGILWAFQPLNVARHIPHLQSHVYAHFAVDGARVAASRMPLAAYTFAVVFLSALLAGAVVFTTRRAFRSAATRTVMDVHWRRLVISAHVVFGVGIVALCCANLAVWAALEANEESTPQLPAANSCVPCHVFIPFYAVAVAGFRAVLLGGTLCVTVLGFLLWPRCQLCIGGVDDQAASTRGERARLVSPGKPYNRIDTMFEEL